MTAQELKNSILQLAVQGKLVPQDKNDEPASELLKRIQAEKARLIKEGKIKKEKALPPIAEEELPFDIPESWEWLRLGDIGAWGSGATPSKSNSAYYNNATIPWLVTGDLNDSIITDIPGKITEKALRETSVKLNPANSVLIAMYGATIGKVGLLSFPATTNQACCACQTFADINLWYLMYFLMSQRRAFIKRGEGGAQPNISKEKIVVTLIPLPPIEEQQRIVDKIEELLPLVEEYGKAETRLKELNADFPDMLRKSILQQAVQGKLTERNPEDEPASELLKRIQAEKAQLIKDGKLKKEKPLPPITEDEIPFDIPESWVWVRLGDLANKLTDGTHKTPIYVETGVPFVSVKDMSSGMLDLSRTKYITKKEHDELCLRCKPEYGDLLISKVGTTGVPAIVKTYTEFSLFVSVALMKFSQNLLDVEYLYYLIYTPLVNGQVKENTKGIGNKNWVIDKIKETLVVLPPLEEQKRIVARVEELLALCDQLK